MRRSELRDDGDAVESANVLLPRPPAAQPAQSDTAHLRLRRLAQFRAANGTRSTLGRGPAARYSVTRLLSIDGSCAIALGRARSVAPSPAEKHYGTVEVPRADIADSLHGTDCSTWEQLVKLFLKWSSYSWRVT